MKVKRKMHDSERKGHAFEDTNMFHSLFLFFFFFVKDWEINKEKEEKQWKIYDS